MNKQLLRSMTTFNDSKVANYEQEILILKKADEKSQREIKHLKKELERMKNRDIMKELQMIEHQRNRALEKAIFHEKLKEIYAKRVLQTEAENAMLVSEIQKMRQILRDDEELERLI